MEDIKLIHGTLGIVENHGGRSCLITQKGQRGAVVFGPYEDRSRDRYIVEFFVGLADEIAPLGDAVCAKLEILTDSGSRLLAERRVLCSELTSGLTGFAISIDLGEAKKLEYRVETTGQVSLRTADHVRVSKAAGQRRRPFAKASLERSWENERELLDGYLRNISGVIHVGANYGQERRYYWLLGLDVIWVEPIREVYEDLVTNITIYPRQRAINALLADEAGKEIELNIGNSGGASSSILPLEQHASIFPDVHYVESRKLVSTTLERMITDNDVDLNDYQALTLDTEGAELLILKGGLRILSHFDYIKCEVADFPARTGNPSMADLNDILYPLGFKQIARREFGWGPGFEGTYWDIVWKKERVGQGLNEPDLALPIVMNPQEVEGIEKIG